MWKFNADTKVHEIEVDGFSAFYMAQEGAFVVTEFRTPWGLFSGDLCDNVAHARRYCLRGLRRRIAEANMTRQSA